jgi:alanine-glyoxylate transaminase/serine-glyoxylate transaminase/serine-pyruvate transaminase
MYALHESLRMVHEEGLENAWERHRRNHEALKAGLEAMGLSFVVDAAHRLPQLNAVSIPEGVDDAAVRTRLLEEHHLEIGAGLGELAGKVWRIGLMGWSSRPENILLCIGGLGMVLNDLGHRADTGAALDQVRAALAA